MEIIHNFGKKQIRGKAAAGNPSLMLAQEGSYLWIGKTPASRYQGWFFCPGGNSLVKAVDDVCVAGGGELIALENGFGRVKRCREKSEEKFFLHKKNCLGYEAGRPGRIEIFLDVKEPYNETEFGRHYRVWREKDIIFINYFQEAPFLLPQVFIAIGGDTKDGQIKEEWVRRDYDYDRNRGSAFKERWVFKPAELFGRRVLFSVGKTKEEAKTALRIFMSDCSNNNAAGEFFAANDSVELPEFKKNENIDLAAAKYCAKNALKMLYSRQGQTVGLRAGLPWFFQFWQRDEAISLKGLAQFDHKTAREIFWRQMEEFKNGKYFFDTADGAGWLFLAAADFFKKGGFSQKEVLLVLSCLEKSIGRLLKNNTQNRLAVYDASQKTWMDSLDRGGAAIEIQALRLNMYALAQKLAADRKIRDLYTARETELARRVKKLFFDGRRLADRYDVAQNCADWTARPNIFLAAYAYPELLPKSDWEKCFDAALESLWLDWGGLSTADRNDPRFCARDTGQDAAAYHNGDSWFWVNNIAAIAMNRINNKKYKDKIENILAASARDLLWGGAAGCASEISSAASYEPCGCPNQAWSNATFLELCQELKK